MKFFITTLFITLSCSLGFSQSNSKIDSLKAKLNTSIDDSTRLELIRSLAYGYAFIHQDTAISYANKRYRTFEKIQ